MTVDLAPVIRFDSVNFPTFPNGATNIQGPGAIFNKPLLLPPGTNIGVSFSGDLTDAVNGGTRQMRIAFVDLRS
jgi:hypothetical protein